MKVNPAIAALMNPSASIGGNNIPLLGGVNSLEVQLGFGGQNFEKKEDLLKTLESGYYAHGIQGVLLNEMNNQVRGQEARNNIIL